MQLQKLIGVLCIFASLNFIFATYIAESQTPGFDASSLAISVSGVGPYAALFNFSVMLSGLVTVVISVLVYKVLKNQVAFIAIALCGLGIFAVGLFPLSVKPHHMIASYAAFFAGPLIAVGSYFFTRKAWSIVFAGLGIFSIISAIVFVFHIRTSLAPPIVERLVVYPFLIFACLIGVYLILGKGFGLKK